MPDGREREKRVLDDPGVGGTNTRGRPARPHAAVRVPGAGVGRAEWGP